MIRWFEELEPRERVVLTIGGILALAIVLWGSVYQTLADGSTALRASLDDKARLLSDLRRTQALRPGSFAPATADTSASLVLLVDSTARSMGLPAFTRTRPDGSDRISVSFQATPFDDLLEWLLLLDSDYAIDVESASFSGTGVRGLVSGQIFLSRT